MSPEVLLLWGAILASPISYFIGKNLVGWLFDILSNEKFTNKKVIVKVSYKEADGRINDQVIDLTSSPEVSRLLNETLKYKETRKKGEVTQHG